MTSTEWTQFERVYPRPPFDPEQQPEANLVPVALDLHDRVTDLDARTSAASLAGTPSSVYIIPVMRNSTIVGTEKLGLWQSPDGYTYTELYPGDLYAGPSPTDNVRDPSLLIGSKAWYVAHTSGLFGQVNYWSLARSLDLGKTWAPLVSPVMDDSIPSGSTTATWSPSFFTDPVDGSIHVIVSIATVPSAHFIYITSAQSEDLTEWDGGRPITDFKGDLIDSFDARTVYSGGFYYMIFRTGSQPVIWRSAQRESGYAPYTIPGTQWEADPGISVEQCQLTHLTGSHWLANFVKLAVGGGGSLYISESRDNMRTWSEPVETLDYTPPNAPHQFSEMVLIRPKTQERIAAPAASDASLLPVWDTSEASGTKLHDISQGGTMRFKGSRAHGASSTLIAAPSGGQGGPIVFHGGDHIYVEFRAQAGFAVVDYLVPWEVDDFDIVVTWSPGLEPDRTALWINGTRYWPTGNNPTYAIASTQTGVTWANISEAVAYYDRRVTSPDQAIGSLSTAAGSGPGTRARLGLACPVYANDAAADADATLAAGAFYRTTGGGRAVFRKP